MLLMFVREVHVIYDDVRFVFVCVCMLWVVVIHRCVFVVCDAYVCVMRRCVLF